MSRIELTGRPPQGCRAGVVPLLSGFARVPTICPAMVGSRKAMALLVLAVLALSLRIAVVAALWSDHAAPVSYEHGRIAGNLLSGKGFSIEFLGGPLRPTSQQAPFYPCFLAGVYACLGIESPASILAVQLIQCLAGTALVLAVVWLAWTLVPDSPAIGWLAGIGAAVHPTHLYMVTHLQVALWAALGLALLLATVSSRRYHGTWRGAILAGGLAGGLLLIEPILALALPVCAVVFWWNDWRRGLPGSGQVAILPHSDTARLRSEPGLCWSSRCDEEPLRPSLGGTGRAGFAARWSRPWQRLLLPSVRVAAMAAIAALVITPWVIRNWQVHHRLVFIKSTFGYAFWQGNNPSSWGTDKIPKTSAETLRLAQNGTLAGMNRAMWEARHETVYIDDVLLRPGGYEELAGLSEVERCDLLGGRATAFIRENPGRYAQLCLNRLRYFFLFDETNPKAANRLYRLTTVFWLVLTFVGLLASAGRWRQLLPTYAIFATVALFHVLVITSVRFRIPIEPISFVWAAGALAPLLSHLTLRQKLRVYRPGEQGDSAMPERHGLQGPHWSRRAA